MKSEHSHLLAVARTMPPLPHSTPGLPFHAHRSAAIEWLVMQPDIRNWLFQALREKRLIQYDPTTGFWHGADVGTPSLKKLKGIFL